MYIENIEEIREPMTFHSGFRSRWTVALILLSALALGSGCQHATSRGTDCSTPRNPERPAQLFEQGRERLDKSRDGEHYRSGPFEEALALLRRAALAGNRDAQSLYGRTLFAARFSNRAPIAEEREDYVSALAAIRRAAVSGDSRSDRYFPGWGDTTVDVFALGPPLDSLPAGWLSEALARAAAPGACSGSNARRAP